ncbi:Alpha/Beta hydrolase protein [Thelonectria olida]|uniref:Alpha/Beta hydrolase protein n=1 Tax=Thelonectria olida TaxID=1576542 RepID=A0A9P9AQA3_9HYPO|nr:Alpha/Beta hydrolase protein [Thelonectria olida]
MVDSPDRRAQTISFQERNADQDTSILFLHGGGGSHVEWKRVASQPSLAAYHLVLVDLPGHSASRDIGPFSLELAADEVQKVIQEHAHHGKAHVVGFSLGAFVTLFLTARHPDRVLSAFATGAYPYKGLFKWAMARPGVMWCLNSIESLPGVPAMTLRMQGIDGEEWLAEIKSNKSWERSKAVMRDLSNFEMGHVQSVADSGVRTCVVAGGKMDQVDAVKEMGVVLRGGGKKKSVVNEAVVVRDAYHPWHLQFPGLFADGVAAWVKGDELPEEFEIL